MGYTAPQRHDPRPGGLPPSLARWTDPGLAYDDSVVRDAVAESERQIIKWGFQTHSPAEWFLILGEELGELGQELCASHFDGRTGPNAKREAIQVAALALKIARMAGDQAEVDAEVARDAEACEKAGIDPTSGERVT